MKPEFLRPFWRYYGAKWRVAPRYPAPLYGTIVESFAGAAGYSLRHYTRRVVLVEKYPAVAEIWRYLIATPAREIMAIPEVDDVHDLPSWVPQEARWLVGFSMNSAASTPRRRLSDGRRKLRAQHRQYEGWTAAVRERVASQVDLIRHWRVIRGDYKFSPNVEATWFIDPPYERAGIHYVHHKIDYQHLAAWCRSRRGQTIVCESSEATWLPFRPFGDARGISGRRSLEGIWTHISTDDPPAQIGMPWDGLATGKKT